MSFDSTAGICVGAPNAQVISNTITNNSRSGEFVSTVAVELSGSGAMLSGNTIAHNTAAPDYFEYGGYVSVRSSGCTLSGNTITNNTFTGYARDGGAVFIDSSGCTLTGNSVSNNTCHFGSGGAVFIEMDDASLSDNTISNNTGRGVFGFLGVDCTLTGNFINNNGGAGVSCEMLSRFTLTQNTISGNTGAGVSLCDVDDPGERHTLAENTITNNGGPGVAVGDSSDFSDNWITGNNGPGIHGRASDVTLSGDRITENPGGGIFLASGNDWDLTGPDDPDHPELCVQIHGNDNYQFCNDNAFSGFGYDDPGNVDARCVYWGTLDEAQIKAGIHDFWDDPSKGVVFYEPYAVPEPTTLALLAIGAIGLLPLLVRRLKRA